MPSITFPRGESCDLVDAAFLEFLRRFFVGPRIANRNYAQQKCIGRVPDIASHEFLIPLVDSQARVVSQHRPMHSVLHKG
jgi:hypothetical protein